MMRFIRPLAVLVAMLAVGRAVASATKSKNPAPELRSKNGSKGRAAASEPHEAKPASSSLLVRTFTVVNRFVEWHELPAPLGLMNLVAIRKVLREENLYDTSPRSRGSTAAPAKPDPHRLYWRAEDGTYNDLDNPQMGRSGVRFGRNVPIEHTFPDPEPVLLSPSPRLVSRKLMTRDTFKPATTLNLLAAAWIQFMTHDWFNHGDNQPDNHLLIPVEDNDPWFEKPMRIRRTLADQTRTPDEADRPPTYQNIVSHWWDASSIYGCDDATCARVRSGVDGKLVVENERLPTDPATGLSITGFNGNWWVGLGLMHTLFTLEHNSICDRLKQEYANWTDERLFQTARLINAALMAKIHTVEWTPAILGHPVVQMAVTANWWGLATERVTKLIGRISSSELISGIPGSHTDHYGVPFTLTEEFAAVYRLHALIPDDIEIHSMATGELLKKLTFPEVVNRNAATVIDDKVSVIDTLYSFGISNPGAIQLHNFPHFLQDIVTQTGVRVDLAAVDITRDRERGIPRYNEFRRLLHLRPFKSIDEITPNKQWVKELKEVYDKDIERVDLMVGMYAETPPKGFGFSDTAFRVFVLMASRRLNSDRFFTTDYDSRVYTQAGIDWVNRNDMTGVLLRHYPELTAPLRGSKNAFAPWQRVS
jgi:hypothetical protein